MRNNNALSIASIGLLSALMTCSFTSCRTDRHANESDTLTHRSTETSTNDSDTRVVDTLHEATNGRPADGGVIIPDTILDACNILRQYPKSLGQIAGKRHFNFDWNNRKMEECAFQLVDRIRVNCKTSEDTLYLSALVSLYVISDGDFGEYIDEDPHEILNLYNSNPRPFLRLMAVDNTEEKTLEWWLANSIATIAADSSNKQSDSSSISRLVYGAPNKRTLSSGEMQILASVQQKAMQKVREWTKK